MHNYHLVELHQTLRNGMEEANTAASAIAGYPVNPMDGVINRLDMGLRRYKQTQAIRSFYFDGPETATPMRRFRLASDLHALYPDMYPKPPVLNVPPLPTNPITKSTLSALIELNGERLPITFSYKTEPYQIDVHNGNIEHFSRFKLFGETIEIPGEGVPIAITYEQAMEWLMSVADGPIIVDTNYWSANEERYETFIKRVRGLRLTLGDLGINQGLPQHLDKILVRARGGALRGEYEKIWVAIRYRLYLDHPDLKGAWSPIESPQ